MADKFIKSETLTAIAKAIRAKKGTTGKIRPVDFASEISTIGTALPINVSTETDMNALLESGVVGAVYKYTGATGTYESGAYYVLEESV